MPCVLTVSSAVYNPITMNVILTGTITGEFCGVFNISVTCGTSTFTGSGAQIPGSILWEGQVPVVGCACGGPITVTITCATDPLCTLTTTIAALCCCPTASTSITYGSCNVSLQETVTFNTTLFITDSCTWQVQRDFGNGNFGAIYTFSGVGPHPLPPETSLYNTPGIYTSNLNVLSPIGCSSVSSVTVNASCAACHTNPLLASFCKALELIFLLSTSIGMVLLINFPTCTPLVVALVFLGIGILALIVFFLLGCQKCVCDPLLKFIAQLFLIMGIEMFLFIPLPVCDLAVTGGVAFAIAIILLAIGFLTLNSWYTSNKARCNLNNCNFWCAVAGIANITSCTNLAIIGSAIMFSITIVPFTKFAGIALVGIVVAIISAIANLGPLSVPPCKNNTPTCM